MTNKDNNLSENTKNTFKDLQDMMNSDPNMGHLFKDDSDKFKDEQREQEHYDEYQSEPTPN